MDQPVKLKNGQRIHVWLVGQWVKATVLGHRHWSHSSGNTFVAYKIDLGTGVIECSANSVRELTETPRRKRT